MTCLDLSPAYKSPDTGLRMAEMTSRTIKELYTVPDLADGAGVRVHRLVGGPRKLELAPILIMDHFKIRAGQGFPDHPHRGQETITYILQGNLNHEDFTGAAGTIGPGDLQCMTAGKGVVHAEMPSPESQGGVVEGIQVWIDLPRELKHCEPRYRDIRSTEYQTVRPSDLVAVRLISGETQGFSADHNLAYTPVWFLDVEIKPGGNLRQPLPQTWNAFVYVLQGNLSLNSEPVRQAQAAILSQSGDHFDLSVSPSETQPARLILIAGLPLDQPVVQHGPFVETSQARIQQAFLDFQLSANGFERALGWKSKIAH